MSFAIEHVPQFITPSRIINYINVLSTDRYHFWGFLLINSPLIYSIYNKSFTFNAFFYSYICCGLIQGIINNYLYQISDYVLTPLDKNAWVKSPFYKQTMLVADATYLYGVGSTVYLSTVVISEPYKWSFEYPGALSILKQFALLIIIHDFVFYGIHYVVHKIPSLRHDHMKKHHDCPLNIASSRCALSSNESEAFVRDLLSAIVGTYFIGFYGYLWMPYYTFYSFWAMYLHTGVNQYHKMHHSNRPMRNYGIYYLSDYLLNTLDYSNDSK